MSKHLTLAEIDGQTAVELPERQLFARAVGIGGLIGLGVAANVNDVIDVENVLNDNEFCVSVAAVASASGCNQ